MRSNTLRKIQKSSKPSASVPSDVLVRWLVPLAIALATWTAFLPVLSNDFVEWDDYENFLSNPFYRGLGWRHIAWMLSTFRMGPYQPLSWLTLGVDYTLWGMNPFGYHLTSLLLHSLNALAAYFVARRLLALAFVETNRRSWPIVFSAAFAALCFALHPLRVESVAWATERRDVLSGLFYLGTIYAYLRTHTDCNERRTSRRWLVTALILYLLSLLSKATAITLPVALLLLDIYPLRRLSWNVRQWFVPVAGNIWREKIPFLLVAILFAALAIFGQQHASALKTLGSYGIGPRLGQVFFGAGFYLWKTFVPVGLSPLYQIPPNYGFWIAENLVGGAALCAISLALFLCRNLWPAGLTCWLYYLALFAPVSGLVQTGPQLAADRYSYLSCLSWAVLAGGILLWLLRTAEQRRLGFAVVPAIALTALTIVVGLAGLTWRQSAVWRNTETLWMRVLETDPNSSFAHYNLARYIAPQGRYQEAIHHYREALRIRPGDTDTHNNLGLLLALTGRGEESLREFHRAVQIDPGYAKGYFNIGRVLARQGDIENSVTNFRKALQLAPDVVEIRLALGAALTRQGRRDEAGAQFVEAVRLKPDSAGAHEALGRWLADEGRKIEAANHYREALRLLESRKQNLPPSSLGTEEQETESSTRGY